MELVNSKNASIRKCAFCKYWYDPVNAAIQPKDPRIGFWLYDPQMKAKCILRNIEKPGFANCHKYECKL